MHVMHSTYVLVFLAYANAIFSHHRLHVGSLECTRKVLRFILMGLFLNVVIARHSATQYVGEISYAKCQAPVTPWGQWRVTDVFIMPPPRKLAP